MNDSDPPSEREEEEKARRAGRWLGVDPAVWGRRAPPLRGFRRLSPVVQRIGSLFIHPLALPFLALGGVLGFVMTFALAFYIGGAGLFFGPVLVGIWGLIMVGLVLVLEQSGYSRNFREWDFPFRKMLYGIPGLLLAVGFFYLLFALLGRHG